MKNNVEPHGVLFIEGMPNIPKALVEGGRNGVDDHEQIEITPARDELCTRNASQAHNPDEFTREFRC